LKEKMPAKAEAPENFDTERKEKPVLTEQQLKILGLVALGLTNQEIADELCLSPATIKNHLSRGENSSQVGIYRRLNVYSRTEAVIKTIEVLGKLDLLELVSEEESARCESLTDRQLEVLGWLANPDLPSLRQTPVEIAAKLSGEIVGHTVNSHLKAIYNNLEIAGRSSAKRARAAVIYLAYKRRKEATSPCHEMPHESSGADG
jgi:ATP/maltotriose-dependent transcriptional regulator MalT